MQDFKMPINMTKTRVSVYNRANTCDIERSSLVFADLQHDRSTDRDININAVIKKISFMMKLKLYDEQQW